MAIRSLKNSDRKSESAAKNDVFAGGGEMGAVMRAVDWSQTPLGPVESWSIALRMMAKFLIANRFPLLLWWGPDFCQLYNDAYRPILGTKHPHFVGRPVRECWSEIWHVLEPLIRTPFEGGPATWMEDILLEINRYGFLEESHFTIAYSPVPDNTAPRGIGGVLATVHEITEKIVGERRTKALRDLGAAVLDERTAEEACARAAEILAAYPKDIPFALIYLLDSERKFAHLAGSTGALAGESISPASIELDYESAAWPLSAVLETSRITVVEDLHSRFDSVPPGPWCDSPASAAIVPIRSTAAQHLAGFLVAGLSPRLRFDDTYSGFLQLLSSQIATAVSNARAYEEERRRAEALAEIDRAKTAFFTNISHEFRTPLSLILGPLEEILAVPELAPQTRVHLDLMHRNSLRLLRLVNTLLDFSRIESERIQAVYEPVELGSFTAELASIFRSAIERAGMKLFVNCPPLHTQVYVDREMWEKIVLNLLSNAFKFTLEGEIEVSIKAVAERVELIVRDTGNGISHDDLPHIFDRFYRVRNARGRSYEGSGIGLALVQEFVRLHGGTVRAESDLGKGTTITVSVPLGMAHLPAERIGAARNVVSTATAAEVYVQEAQRSLSVDAVADDPAMAVRLSTNSPEQCAKAAGGDCAQILLADDNADMRDYLQRVLAGRYKLVTVSDGQAALEAALQNPPDLVLTDVMMPRLDGFGLLKALRGNERLASIPILLLSARAGEESHVEGLGAGADDYLIKPFSARELVARVEKNLALSRLRLENEKHLREIAERLRESEERFRALVMASSDVVYRMSPDWSEMWNLQGREFIADTLKPNKAWLQEYIHPDDQAQVMAVIREAIRTKSVFQMEHRVLRVDGTLGWTFSRAIPLFNTSGEVDEWFGAATDITQRKQAEAALMRTEKLASVGQIAATIAHEINNPLEAVTNTLFLANAVDGVPESARQYLEIADAELRRVAHITRQSLGFYRESASPALTSVAAILNSAIDLLKAKIDAKRAVIEKQWNREVQVTVVAGELRQVISNLLMNSLDAIDDKGRIVLRVSAPTKMNDDGARHIRITVSDNGKGIEAASRQHIFEPFYTTKGAVGTGLGLWVSRQLIDKHGGSIRIRSSSNGPRRGTTFVISLPC